MLQETVKRKSQNYLHIETKNDFFVKTVSTFAMSTKDTDDERYQKIINIQNFIVKSGPVEQEARINCLPSYILDAELARQFKGVTYDSSLIFAFKDFKFAQLEKKAKDIIFQFPDNIAKLRIQYSKLTVQTFFSEWLNLAHKYPFVSAAAYLMQDAVKQIVYTHNLNFTYSELTNLTSLNKIQQFVLSKIGNLRMPDINSMVSNQANDEVNPIALNAIINKKPLKFQNHSNSFKLNKQKLKKILYWCENCQCDKCLQQKKQYFDRKKKNVSFHAIEVIEEDAFGIECDDVICIESQSSCPFEELMIKRLISSIMISP
ncbi:hypothetical protein C6P40_000124 [Pichia californica]|uniref:Uncharacterized protein n=1 Tax=Pichia californica TaxID=460514 RepID=A0A9P6WL95_9ASCO|nr:hypothetical protein C6P42_005244 [[Candida] californica]KAG0689097.1 hypothetical protein C6P40_000124 [[Candida] californica]